MDRHDLLPLLQTLKTEEEYFLALDRLRSVDEVELFHGLFFLAVERPNQTPERPSYVAGNLLFDINPACQISCLEAVKAMLFGWNVSLEEVPFYVYRQFGMAEVQVVIKQLEVTFLTTQQRQYLDSVKYWVSAVDGWGLDDVLQRREKDRNP